MNSSMIPLKSNGLQAAADIRSRDTLKPDGLYSMIR